MPPAPSRFSTITGWPRLACSFSETMRAIVSDALPGVTPETRRTVFQGNVWACAVAASRAGEQCRNAQDACSRPVLLRRYFRGNPSRSAIQSALRLR